MVQTHDGSAHMQGSRKKRIADAVMHAGLFNIIMCVILLLSLVLVIFGRTLNLVRVVGTSMEPSYRYGEILMSSRDVSRLECGDVVMAHVISDEMPLDVIKRVEGIPGDTLLVKDGILYRNGQAVDEPYDRMEEAGILSSPVTLGENEYFLLGDNRNESDDSRFFGKVPLRNIERVVTGRFLPWLF